MENLDLGLAFRRVVMDHQRGRTFGDHPFELELVRSTLARWLADLSDALQKGTYSPSPAMLCEVPKKTTAVRPGSRLTLEDEVVFAASVGACMESVYRDLNWPREPTDFSYWLARGAENPEWFRNPFDGWQQFRERSIALLTSGEFSHVLMTDIAGYYEHVELSILSSDLRQCGVSDPVVRLLSTCLNRWTYVPNRGIPQGPSPAHILGKLYLNTVDRSLREVEEFIHHRYVDDFRIFCRSEGEARRAAIVLARLLRERGLLLSSAKTRIVPAKNAIGEIKAVEPVIKGLIKKYSAQVQGIAGLSNPYMTVAEADRVVASIASNPPIAVIRQAYHEHFLAGPDSRFDKTLFHFLIRRLARHGDDYAFDHCVRLLWQHPEETKDLLAYFAATGRIRDADEALVEYLSSAEAVFDYQYYQIFSWRVDQPYGPGAGLLRHARSVAFRARTPRYLRATVRRFLGQFGTPADHEALERGYADAGSDLERSEILMSLHRMERGKRNALLGRARHDGMLCAAAAEMLRRG